MIHASCAFFIYRVPIQTDNIGTPVSIQLSMTDETCPERIDLVQRLAEAMNGKKRAENNDSHSVKARIAADEKVNHAVEALRSNKAEGGCQAANSRDASTEKDPAA